MTNSQQKLHTALWQLLRAGLWNQAPAEPARLEGEEWDLLLEMARRNNVVSIVADGIALLDDTLLPPQPQLTRWMVATAENVDSHRVQDEALGEIAELLDTLGAHAVLLKGQGCASFYREPQSRHVGDIDIYLPPADFDRIVDIFVDRGLANPGQMTDNGKHIEFPYRASVVELHRFPARLPGGKRDRSFRRWADSELQSASAYHEPRPGSLIALPPATFNVFFLFWHSLETLLSPLPRLKHIPDIAMALHHYGFRINREKLREKLEEYGLMKAWQTMGCLLVDIFGLDGAEFPFYDSDRRKAAEKLAAYIERECFDGEAAKRPGRPDSFVLGKLYTISSFARSTSALLSVFPSEAASLFLSVAMTGIDNAAHLRTIHSNLHNRVD